MARVHPSHDVPPDAWRCARCQTPLSSIDIRLRCVEPAEALPIMELDDALPTGRLNRDPAASYFVETTEMPDWTDERRAKLKELRGAGKSITQITKALNCSRSSVTRVIIEMGLPLPSRAEFYGVPVPVSWDTARAEKLWADMSLTTPEIAAQLGITKNSLCGYAGRHRHLFPERVAHHSGINKFSVEEKSVIREAAAARRAGLRPKRKCPSYGSTSGGHVIPVVTLAPLRSIPPKLKPIFAAPAPKPEPTKPRSATCLYPMWGDDERPTHRYCDNPNVVAGSVYCATHKRLCHVTVAKSYLPPVTGSGPGDKAGIAA